MNVKQLHDQIMSAMSKCPNYRPWKYSDAVDMGYFGTRRYASVEDVVRFWLHDDVLWNKGYCDCLPLQAKKLFSDVSFARSQAITTAVAQFLNPPTKGDK